MLSATNHYFWNQNMILNFALNFRLLGESGFGGCTVSSTRRLHLLIVDDDASVRETLAMVLSKANYVTSTAKDGVDALAQFRTRVPDLLLTDLEMTRISGVDFLCSVRLSFPEVAVVAMSCISDEEHVRVRSSPMRFTRRVEATRKSFFEMSWMA